MTSASTIPAPAAGPVDLVARWMATMGPIMSGLQLGSAVGHLARGTFGQYELPIPRPSATSLLVIPANVEAFVRDWSLPGDEARLWVCLREMTIHAVVSRPHVADRLRALMTEIVQGMAGDTDALADRLQGLDPTDPESLQRMFGDPEAFLGGDLPPERQRVSDELTAITTALLGYVDHVLERAGDRLLGGRTALAEAWRRRQVDRENADRSAELLVGLDLGPSPGRAGRPVRAGCPRAGRRRGPGPVVVGSVDAAHPGRGRRPRTLARADQPGIAADLVFVGDPQIPFELQVLALGITDDAFTVAAELGVVGREEGEPGDGPVPEGVDHGRVAVVGLDLPVRRDRSQVDHTDVTLGRLRFFLDFLQFFGHSGSSLPMVGSGSRAVRISAQP